MSGAVSSRVAGGAAAALALALSLAGPLPLAAQLEAPPELRGVGVDERPGEPLPLDARFTDEDGRSAPLGAYFASGRPVLVVPGYYRCRMLCGVVASGLLGSLGEVEGWTPGHDYEVVAVSVDPREGPGDAAHRRRAALGGDARGWHLLTGERGAVEALARSVGFRYRYDPDTDQFAHAAVVVAATPEGTVARYVYGVDPDPDTLAAVLASAREGRSASSLERVLVRCFRYTPALRRHVGLVANLLRGGGVAILVGLAGVFVVAGRRAVTDRGRA